MFVRQFDGRRQLEYLYPELLEKFQQVVESGQFILGPEVSSFELGLADYLNVDYVVGMASGTDALMLALQALDIGPGDEVIVPALTFAATATAVMSIGAIPVVADIDPSTFCLTQETVAAVKNDLTKAIIAVDLYGLPAPVESLHNYAKGEEVWLIEDAAQSLGAAVGVNQVGKLGADITCFSFFPTKTLGALGDGGACATDSQELNERLRMLRAHGAKEKYMHETLGRNSRLDEIQAAWLNVKLSYLDGWVGRRNEIASIYSEVLGSFFKVPQVPSDHRHAWHQYTLRVRDRAQIRAELLAEGIETAVHYPLPLHHQPFWTAFGLHGHALEAEVTAQEVLSLPMWPEMTDREVHFVCSQLARVAHD